MKVGDLVMMPGQKLQEGEPQSVAVVLRTEPDGVYRGTPGIGRVKVYWIQDEEMAWEPKKWLEVINATSR